MQLTSGGLNRRMTAHHSRHPVLTQPYLSIAPSVNSQCSKVWISAIQSLPSPIFFPQNLKILVSAGAWQREGGVQRAGLGAVGGPARAGVLHLGAAAAAPVCQQPHAHRGHPQDGHPQLCLGTQGPPPLHTNHPFSGPVPWSKKVTKYVLCQQDPLVSTSCDQAQTQLLHTFPHHMRWAYHLDIQ